MEQTKAISEMTPDELKKMHKECEQKEREESRRKHQRIQEEFREVFKLVSEAFARTYHILPSVIIKEILNPMTSSKHAFKGTLGTTTGTILYCRALFKLFNLKFELKRLLVILSKAIENKCKLWITDRDPSLPYSSEANYMLLLHPIETKYLREQQKKLAQMREDSYKSN